jgi:uncharacterized protein YycO
MEKIAPIAGDILLTSSPLKGSPVSAAIKIGTGSTYSHAMLCVGAQCVVEAISRGVLKRPLSEATLACDKVTAFRHSQATDDHIQRLVHFAESKLAGEYSLAGSLGGSGILAAVLPLSLPLIGLRSATNAVLENQGKKRSYYCSELIADAYLSVGLPLGIWGRAPSLMNPGDIAEYSDRNSALLVKLGDLS